MRNVIWSFDPKCFIAVEKCQARFNENSVTSQLSNIESNFVVLVNSITKSVDLKLSLIKVYLSY